MTPELTDKQKEVVHDKHGLFVVKACPGSGKTLTVAARLSRLLASWRSPHVGVAAMSFTNTAWHEVERYLSEDYGVAVPLGYPHYLGTIDSFINRFIFLPFGHKAMDCGIRPELTGPPHNDFEPIGRWLYWQNAECNRSGCWLNDFSYNEKGELIHLASRTHFCNCQSNHGPCSRLKVRFNTAGYATQADSNYFSLKLLEHFLELAFALSHRFPFLIIDEAQDSSVIQMRIIELLIRAGVKEVMLVGDPYQAIYEWRQAETHLFVSKYNEWQDNCVWLSENWRSTQSICDLACRLANSSDRITAMNQEIAPYDHAPLLYGYDNESDLPGLLEAFCEHCTSRGIDRDAVSVLTRSREFINAVVPGSVLAFGLVPWRDNDTVTRQIAYSKYLFDHGDFRNALRRLEVAAYGHLTGKSGDRREAVTEYARSKGFGKWRGLLFRLLCELPTSQGFISAWLPGANRALSSNCLFPKCIVGIKNDRRPHKYSEVRFEDVFAPPTDKSKTDGVASGTVHSVKGRSLEAVFLVLKSRGAAGRNYVNLLGSDLLQEEELRIVYVAATRARKALAIAVPQSDVDRWREYLFTPGK
jgi:superfamily I DNA/RNA helicase